ncbi:MAG: hypothetical protein WBN92_16000 [Terriglobia bacterium]
MPRRSFTFHEMLEGCREGDPSACIQLVQSYLPLLDFGVDHYFPWLSPDRDQIIRELLGTTLVKPGGLLTTFQGTWEREFLFEWRRLTLEGCYARALLGNPVAASPLQRDELASLLKNLPLLHQELIWFHLCHIPAEEVVQILSMRSEVAEPILAKALPRDVGMKWTSQSDERIPLMPPRLLIEIDSERGDDCVSVKLWSKIIDGQALWSEKEKADGHTTNCLCCLSTLTALKETIFKLRTLPGADPLQVQKIVAAAWDRPAVKKSSGTTLGRLFKKT